MKTPFDCDWDYDESEDDIFDTDVFGVSVDSDEGDIEYDEWCDEDIDIWEDDYPFDFEDDPF